MLVGCGPSHPACYPVSGKVIYDGQTVTQGTITFYPEQGRSALGKIEPDGTYSLTTFSAGDGALPGRHAVTIQSTLASGPDVATSFEEEHAQAQSGRASGSARLTWLVPETYARRESTPLSETVREKRNVIDFDIPAVSK